MSDTGTGTEAGARPADATAGPSLLPAPGAGPEGPRPPGGPPETESGEAPRLGAFLARAAAGTAVLTVLAAVLGLVRDQAIARYFGASDASDAFLIAWTVPEMAATLLIEDGMALLLVPAFSLALTRRASGETEGGADPVRDLVAATLPRLFLLLSGGAALLIAGAPWVVGVLAPGLADPRLAVDCTRLTAVTVLTFGITGYFSAALRAHGSFLPPAGVYVAYNLGIIGMTLALHAAWGVRAAAAGVAVGSALMILTQLPMLLRLVPLARPRLPRFGRLRRRAARSAPLLGFALLAPVVVFVVSRQSQVLVERFLASTLPAGAISHLNYAQKVAQMPMVLSLMICTVTFPVVAQAMAAGEHEKARRRVERDLGLAGMVVLLGTAVVLGHAPQIVEVLFQRGAFDAADTASTAQVMRVYALGLLGHCLVGAYAPGHPALQSVERTGTVRTSAGAGAAVSPAWAVERRWPRDAAHALCAVLRSRGRTLGVLTFLRAANRAAFERTDAAYAETVAARVAGAVDLAQVTSGAADRP
ncbi:lipid II flippase MurJ [Streptomyces parvus]|uniref:lipid II flippase MurJ n=1 Tax=Streptomyces parvus TaxID=66428 RepID=UPI0021CCFCC0|nr:lipid II flippase MurJ [Streptomyces parvus]